MNGLNSKKIWLVIGLVLLVFVGYRGYQFKVYLDSMPKKSSDELQALQKQPEKCFRKVILKKGTGLTLNDDEDYSKSAMDVEPTNYDPSDTLFLKEDYVEAVEFEVLADSTVTFRDIEIVKDPNNTGSHNEKPWHRKDRDSYALSTGRAIWVFMPYVYGSNVQVRLTFDAYGETFTKIFPISVLDAEAYSKTIERRLSPKEKEIRAGLIIKNKALLAKYWGYQKQGSGKKSIYGNVWDSERFQKENPQFKEGWIFSNQYTTIESGFRVILTAGNRENVEVEPINNTHHDNRSKI